MTRTRSFETGFRRWRSRPDARGPTPPRWPRWLAALAGALLLAAACAPGAPEGSDVSGPGEVSREVTIAWERPTRDAQGGSLGDLAGFRIYVTQDSPVTRSGADMIEVEDTTRHTFSEFEPGVYFLAVSAVDTAGNESQLSDQIRAEVEGS